jgi:hypothetical protein
MGRRPLRGDAATTWARYGRAAGGDMDSNAYRIPKREQSVELLVDPDGPVSGELFLLPPGPDNGEGESPLDVLNQREPFVVVRCGPDEIRCYNKRFVIEVRFREPPRPDADTAPRIPCRFRMYDGREVEGCVREYLPPEHSRLIDYLNYISGSFIRLELEEGLIALLNKTILRPGGSLGLSSGPRSWDYWMPFASNA